MSGYPNPYYGNPYYQCQCPPQKSYGFFHFLGDVFMTIFTGGFWLIWIFVRELRKR